MPKITMALAIASVLVASSIGVASLQDVHAEQSGEKTTIKIGTLLTGSETHQYRLKAMELARDDFNAKNDNYVLELVNYRINPNGEGSEPHHDSRTGAQIKNAFTKDNITYFVGPMGSTDTRSAKAQLEILIPANPNADFAVISPASTDPRLRIDDNVFRMVIDDSQQAVVLAGHLNIQNKTHVVMIGLNNSDHPSERDSWSEGIEIEFRKHFDGTIVEHFTLVRDINQNAVYDTLAQNLNTIVSRLANDHGADNVAIVAMVYADDTSQIVQAVNRDSSLANLGMVKWYGPDGVAFRSEVTADNPAVGTFLARVGFTASQYAGDSNPVKDDVMKRLLNNGVPSKALGSIYIYSSYDATSILANAIAQRNSMDDAKTVKQLLHEIAAEPNKGALGDYGFNDEGDLDEPFNFKLGTIALNYSDQKPQWVEHTTITIGALVQYTQENNDAANLKAMELSVKDINNDHRTSSEYTVDLVPVDITSYVSSGNIPGLVQRVSAAIQNEGITYFVGPTTSAETGPIKSISDQIPNTVFVSPGSSSPILPLPGGGGIIDLTKDDGIFRLVPNETHQANDLTRLMLEADNQKTIILVRDQWEGIVAHLITDIFDQNVDYPLVTFKTAESFAGDKSAALTHHRMVAGDTNDRLEQILSSYDSKYVALMFIGYPLDFEYHVQAILSSEDNLDNLYAVDWYGASTFIGEPASLRDSNVAKFAEDVSLAGTRYTVEPNDVNQRLCDRLSDQGITCDRYATELFASYDAVHLLVDSIIAQDERASDNDPSNDRTARELVLRVAAGDEEHRLQHAGRTIGDGALGVYALSAGGDLNEPATYTPLRATAGSGWVPAVEQLRICR